MFPVRFPVGASSWYTSLGRPQPGGDASCYSNRGAGRCYPKFIHLTWYHPHQQGVPAYPAFPTSVAIRWVMLAEWLTGSCSCGNSNYRLPSEYQLTLFPFLIPPPPPDQIAHPHTHTCIWNGTYWNSKPRTATCILHLTRYDSATEITFSHTKSNILIRQCMTRCQNVIFAVFS